MGGSYRPDAASSHQESRPRKRKRTDNHVSEADPGKESIGQQNSRIADAKNSSTNSRHPQSSRGRPGQPTRKPWRPSKPQLEDQPASEKGHNGDHADQTPTSDQKNLAQRRNHKSSRVRKENPSSKIHSLQNLLKRGTLPPPVQAEKERELSALIFEREKKKLKQEHKRNLERYHFVRFMERQKAQRTIKSLRKRQNGGFEHDISGRDLKGRLEEAQIDLNYTIYAPLGEKYISIFAEQRKGTPVSKAEKYKGNWKLLKPEERKLLDDDRVEELQKASMESANVLEMFGNTPDEADKSADAERVKPPMWYEVKAAMEQGGNKLEALRDRMSTNNKKSQELVMGIAAGSKRKGNQLEDDGETDPVDPDVVSDEELLDVDSRSNIKKRRARDAEHDDYQGDDTSDGDGGFFEKR